MRIEFQDLAAASVVVNTSGTELAKIYGYFNGAANRYLQLYDAKAVPANNANEAAAIAAGLVRTWPIYSTAPFEFDFVGDTINLANGCVLVISSTKDNLTISADTADFFVTGESSWNNSGTTVAGDYVTADEVLQVWADAAGPKKLVRLEVSDVSELGDVFVQIHAGDTPATDKIVASFPVVTGGVIDKHFGAGLYPKRMVDGVIYDGCTIAISSTQNTYTARAANVDYIKATYR